MLEAFSGLIDIISSYMYSYILIIMLLGVGLYTPSGASWSSCGSSLSPFG